MNSELIAPLVSIFGAALLAVASYLLKRLLNRIDGLDNEVTALDAMTSAKIHNLDQATQARIAGVEHVADAKIQECQLRQTKREDGLMRLIVEHANEADRKYATVREMLNVQERLLAIDNNVRAVLSAIERLLSHGTN